MSLNNLQNTFLPYTINGLQDVNTDSQITQNLQILSLNPNKIVVSDSNQYLVSAGASTTEVDYLIGATSNIQNQLNNKLNLSGSNANQNINISTYKVQSSSIPSTGDDYTNKTYVDTQDNSIISNISTNYLNKTTSTPQTVISNVSYTGQLISDNLFIPENKEASLAEVVQVSGNYRRNENDAGITANYRFGPITSSLGIYQSTTTGNFASLGLATLTIGKRYKLNINVLGDIASYTSSIQLYASTDGQNPTQSLGPSVSFLPSSTIFQLLTGTFVPQYQYIILLCINASPTGSGLTVKWYGLELYETGVELEKITLPLLTASKIPILNSNKQLISSGVDSSKIDYLDNVSSDIQTQLNNKLNLSGSNANQNINISTYKVQSSSIPSIGDDYTNKTYVDTAITGLSSTYAKLSGPQTFTGTHTFNSITPIKLSGLTSSRVLQLDSSNNIQTSIVSTTELGYLSGVNSGIQSQIDGKASTSYVNTQDNLRVLKGGDTMTGILVNSITNTYANRANNPLTQYNIRLDSNTQRLYMGSYYTGGEGACATIQSSDYYSSADHGTSLLINPLGGSVGIGTSDVIGLFNIFYNGSEDFLTLQNKNYLYASDEYINMRFMFGKNSASSGSAYIQGRLNSSLETDLIFYVDDGTPSVSERFRIKGNGKLVATGMLGIGESSPSAPLHIKASSGGNPSTNGIYVYNTTNSAGQDAIITVRTAGSSGGNPFISFDVAGEAGWSWGMDNADNSMKLSYSWSSLTSATKMTMNTSGRLGIGCSPTAPLTVGSITIVDGTATPGVYQPGCIYTDVNWGMLFRAAVSANIAFMRWDRYDGATIMKIQNTGVFNFTGGGPNYAVDNGQTTRRGAMVIGTINESYGGGWQAGLLMECQDTTEISCHDSGNRLTSFIYYDGANRMYIGRDIGWGITPISLKGRVAINGEVDTTAQLCITNPNGTITHFGYNNNYNYIRGALTQIDTPTRVSNWVEATEVYTNNYFRINNNNTGLYWEYLGRGIRSPEGEGNSYGNISTFSTGRNGWSGYGIGSRFCWMASGDECGLHDNLWSWGLKLQGGFYRDLYLAAIARASPQEWDRFVIWRISENDWGNGYWYWNQAGGSGYASDMRIKKDIAPLESNQSVSFIKHLQPSKFRMKDTEPCCRINPDGSEVMEEAKGCNCLLQDGFIAQNILEACDISGVSKSVLNNWSAYEEMMKKPEEERKIEKDNVLGVGDRPILSHTVNVVKVLLDKVETLESEMNILKERNIILEQHARQQEEKLNILISEYEEYKKLTESRFEKLTNLFLSLNK
jgi:hypothetical protein